MYNNSKITHLDFYKSCMIMTSKSSNNQEIIDRMPYWKFINLSKILAQQIEQENSNNGEGGNVEEQSNKLMSNAKNSLPKMKPPKTSLPKLK